MEKENNAMLKKILNCLYIIIALICINTVIVIVVNGDSKSSSEGNNSTSDYDVSMFETVDPEKLLTYFEASGTYVLYMGSSSCTYCKQFLPSLQEAQSEYGYKTLYLPVDEISTSTDEFAEFIAKLNMEYSDGTDTGEFGEFYGYTPTVVIIKDGKQIAGEIGAMSYSALTEMLEKAGITK